MLANCCGAGTGTAAGTGAGTGTGTATGKGTGSETGFSAGIAVRRGSGTVTGLAVTRGSGAVGAVATVTDSVGVTGDVSTIGAGVGGGDGVWAPATGGAGRLRSAEAGLTTAAPSSVLSGAGARFAPSSITRVFNAETCSGPGCLLSGSNKYQCPTATTAQSSASVRQFGRPLGVPLTSGDGAC